jgi:hypothetical protein
MGIGIICKEYDAAGSDPSCPDSQMFPTGTKIAKDYDFDGDGRADLAVANYSSNNVSVLLGALFLPDLTITKGIRTTYGSTIYRDHVPDEDALVVQRLKAAGGILLGKTNCPELGWAWESDNLIYGRTNNPYDLSLSPGGSSGGESAVIAAGGSPLGLVFRVLAGRKKRHGIFIGRGLIKELQAREDEKAPLPSGQ